MLQDKQISIWAQCIQHAMQYIYARIMLKLILAIPRNFEILHRGEPASTSVTKPGSFLLHHSLRNNVLSNDQWTYFMAWQTV